MLRKAAALLLFVASMHANALSIKHVEQASVALDDSLTISAEQQRELRAKLRKAEAACISPPDFVVTVELVSTREKNARSVSQTTIVRDYLIANGVPASLIFEGETSVEHFRARQAKNSSIRPLDIGNIKVEIVCTANE